MKKKGIVFLLLISLVVIVSLFYDFNDKEVKVHARNLNISSHKYTTDYVIPKISHKHLPDISTSVINNIDNINPNKELLQSLGIENYTKNIKDIIQQRKNGVEGFWTILMNS